MFLFVTSGAVHPTPATVLKDSIEGTAERENVKEENEGIIVHMRR